MNKMYQCSVAEYAENGLMEAEKIEGPLGLKTERSMGKDLIEQAAYDFQREYGVTDKEREKVMLDVYNRMFSTSYTSYKQIW